MRPGTVCKRVFNRILHYIIMIMYNRRRFGRLEKSVHFFFPPHLRGVSRVNWLHARARAPEERISPRTRGPAAGIPGKIGFRRFARVMCSRSVRSGDDDNIIIARNTLAARPN